MTYTLAEALSVAQSRGVSRSDAEVLLSHLLEKDRTYLIAWPEKQLTREQVSQFLQMVTRRENGEPVAYITGVREFWSLPIRTAPSTLIPRPDTEVLVETVLERHDGRPGVCLDLGTGTGAIALALKSERPAWTVTGIDSVAAAVELAIANARQLSLDVAFITGNWCDSIQEKSLDIIVSNPPYIDAEDTHLKEGDVRFEPLSALVSGQKGYQDISLIVAQAVVCLKPGGSVYFEHGWQQAQGVRAILIANGFVDVETRKDYGGNDRVTFGRLKTEQG